MEALGRRLAEDAAGDAAEYADYLRVASGVDSVARAKRDRDRLLGLRAGSRALEVGCGLGDDARRLAEFVMPGGEVVGLDVSEALLDRARRAAPGVTWVAGDAHELPFATASFDAARVERALQHVADPVQVLAEMARVVRIGGVVMACEPDWATLALSASRQDLVDALQAAAESSIAHPRVGRTLPALLDDAGLAEVVTTAETIVVRDFALLSALADLPALAAVMADDGADSSEVAAFVAELRKAGARGRLLGTMTLVSAWGRAA